MEQLLEWLSPHHVWPRRPNALRLLFYSSKSTGCPEGEAASPYWCDPWSHPEAQIGARTDYPERATNVKRPDPTSAASGLPAASGSARSPSGGCASPAGSPCTAPARTSTSSSEWTTSSPSMPSSAAPRMRLVSASTSTFMKPCVSPRSLARPTRVIGIVADERLDAFVAHLALGHAGAAERRVDEQRVGGDAVGHPARLAVEQVCGDDLVVVVRGMRERAAAVDVAQRPDARDVGLQLVVDDDVAALVERDARPLAGRGRRCSAGGPSRAADASRRSRAAPPRTRRRRRCRRR